MSTYTFSSIEHFYYKDFTPFRNLLQEFSMGEVIGNDEKGNKLCDALNEMETEGDNLWTLSSRRTDWCLLGATVKYNGINRRDKNCSERFKFVLVFELDIVTTPKGRFVLHYDY